MNDNIDLARALRDTTAIAVVGLSANPGKPSHQVASYLQKQGYRIVPVNPNETRVLGETCYSALLEIPDTIRIDLVNVFRRSEAVPAVVKQAIQIGAKGIWMQEGVVHPVAAEQARRAGLWVVMDRCLMIEHRRHVS